MEHSVGDYDYYVEKKQRAVAAENRAAASASAKSAAPSREPAKSATKARKLSFKEQRELDGMEAVILTTEEEIARIEDLFAKPDFHREHGDEILPLTTKLAAARAELVRLFARWEELEKARQG